MSPSSKKQIEIGLEHLITFESEMSALYGQLKVTDKKFAEFWESAALLKSCRAKIYRNILEDYSGAGDKYSLVRGITGPFINLISKVKTFRNSQHIENGYNTKISDFIDSIESAVENNNIWPVIDGQTLMFQKAGSILNHIQFRQVRLIKTMSEHRSA